jgi:hemolysin D
MTDLAAAEKLKRQAYQFLPAALEATETPPSPIGRVISLLIILLFTLAVAWGWYGKLDVVATAQGKIIPSGRVKTIQPLEIGTVKFIHVKDGQLVKKGDTLITLDNTLIEADADQMRQQLAMANLKLIRQEAFKQLLMQEDIPLNWQAGAVKKFREASDASKLQDFATQQQLFVQQVQKYLYRKQALDAEYTQRKSEQEGASVSITKIERTLPIITERTQSYKTLMEEKIMSRHQYLEMEQQRIVQEQDLKGYKVKYQELESGIGEVAAQLDTLKAETQKNNLKELNETQVQVDAYKQELKKSKQRNKQQILTAPIEGTIQQLAIHTVGGIVTPAQELMQIVPESSVLEVEAFLLNKDIGFVEEGMEVEVKIDTFDFTKYGMIHGKIIDLSNNAIADENLGLIYQCIVEIKKTQMQINDKLVNLSPGMSVMVEVKTGQRKIIEYFLSPVLKYKHESIRER